MHWHLVRNVGRAVASQLPTIPDLSSDARCKGRVRGVLVLSVPQQALDLNSQEVWATATAEQCVATTRTERWKFTCRELESNHPQSVIIFYCSRAPREFSVVDRRDIIRRTPRQHIGFVNPAGALEIDRGALFPRCNRNVRACSRARPNRWHAILKEPAPAVSRILPARRQEGLGRLLAFDAEQGPPSRFSREPRYSIAAVRKFAKTSGHWNSSGAARAKSCLLASSAHIRLDRSQSVSPWRRPCLMITIRGGKLTGQAPQKHLPCPAVQRL